MESVKETVKIRVCKGGAWERVDGALEYMPLNCVKRTLILPLLSSYSCLLEAVSERLEIDANSEFMVTYNSDNDIVEVCDDLEVNEFMEFVVKSSRIVTLCIVESSVNGRQSSNSGSNQQKVMSESSRIYKGKEIMTDMNGRFKIDISYSQAWRAKCYALQLLRGTPEESFSELPLYCHNLKLKNQGTITHIKTDNENRFEIFFLAVGAVEELFWKTCKAYRISDFEERFSTLRDWLPSIANKLDMIGLEKWARVHFPGMRYNYMTSNSAESVNALSRYSRKLPICMMIDWFIKSLQHWYFEHRETTGHVAVDNGNYWVYLVGILLLLCDTCANQVQISLDFHVSRLVFGGLHTTRLYLMLGILQMGPTRWSYNCPSTCNGQTPTRKAAKS
nr:hypothetical protein [Tanacetum cinerariifolium]